MCLILVAWQAHPDYALVLAANRDEFFHRPTAPAQFWSERTDILAGRDLQQGGTWLGLRRDGRFAAVTNFRKPGSIIDAAPSRGLLVSEFLQTQATNQGFFKAFTQRAPQYNGFNLLASDRRTLWHYSNRGGPPEALPPGVHGLSNHLLNTPWPKVVSGRERLQQLIARPFGTPDMLKLLDDTKVAADNALPETGVGLERERMLSATRIVAPGYGTRCSTALLIRHDGGAEFCERTYREDGSVADTVNFSFVLTD